MFRESCSNLTITFKKFTLYTFINTTIYAEILRKNAKFEVKMSIYWAEIVQMTFIRPQIKA